MYAYFGAAVYHAQVLESGLVNALMFLDFIPTNAAHFKTRTDWSDKFEAFEDDKFKLTMGNLMRDLRKVLKIPEPLEASLKDALEKRKFLVHHYFRERILFFEDEAGRDRMIVELDGYMETFRRADRMLDGMLEPSYQRFGFTAEKQAEAMEEMKRQHYAALGQDAQ